MSADRYYEPVYDPETGTMVMRPKWRLNEPGYARMSGYSGELVVGPSGHKREDMERRAENERLRKEKKIAAQRERRQAARDAAPKGYPSEEERLEARRTTWRESKRRAREAAA